jgi:hypothetical protein
VKFRISKEGAEMWLQPGETKNGLTWRIRDEKGVIEYLGRMPRAVIPRGL